MLQEFIDRILELAQPQTVEVEGLTYTPGKLELVPPPEPKSFDVTTLDGFVNLLEVGIDNFDVSKCLIHVKGYAEVALLPRHATDYGKRRTIISAGILKGLSDFTYFNQWGPQEEFCIGLQSHFQESTDLASLIALASHIDMKESAKLTDDGRAQEVIIQRGVAFKETTETKKRMTLKPFRTFRELDQPPSDFIFRVKAGGGMALFEADGGAWKIAAIAEISSWLANRIKTSENAALANLPIIS